MYTWGTDALVGYGPQGHHCSRRIHFTNPRGLGLRGFARALGLRGFAFCGVLAAKHLHLAGVLLSHSNALGSSSKLLRQQALPRVFVSSREVIRGHD